MEPSLELAQRRERAERLGTALSLMARDLAEARHEIAVLRRENARLRSRLAALQEAAPGPSTTIAA